MLHANLKLDWWWLYLQVTILAVIVIREFLRPRQRNLFAILIAGTMLVLVHCRMMVLPSLYEGFPYSLLETILVKVEN